MSTSIPTLVLGGSGYVAGELLRLIFSHPYFELTAVMSDSRPGEPIAQAFPHLASAYPRHALQLAGGQIENQIASCAEVAVFSAAPHGAAAALIDTLLTRAAQSGTRARVVDISADFRYRSAAAYDMPPAIRMRTRRQRAHRGLHLCTARAPGDSSPTAARGTPGLLCDRNIARRRAAPRTQIGERATLRRRYHRQYRLRPQERRRDAPSAAAQRPVRLQRARAPPRPGDAANCLRDACRPGRRHCLRPALRTVRARHSRDRAGGTHGERTSSSAARQLAALRSFYAHAPFVRVTDEPPRIKNVVTSTYAHLSAVANGRTVAVLCAIDNLTKGAAGGALQWMNRLFGLPETSGLTTPAPGWT